MSPTPEDSARLSTAPAVAPSLTERRSPHRHAGWSLRCDGDEISEISHGGVVLLESLRPALRDPNWETITPRVTEPRWEEDGRTSRRTQRVEHTHGSASAHAVTELEITADVLRCRLTLTTGTDLLLNRAGLTVMLPRAVAGLDGLVRTPEGAERSIRLPRLISPFQPVFDIRRLDLDHGGVRFRLDLLGDVFEMEDQRNWTDASFKLYSRPLALPFPYLVRAGEQVEQEVTLTLLPSADHSRIELPSRPSEIPTDVDAVLEAATRCVLPAVGTGATTQYSDAVTAPAARVEGLSHLLVETSEGFPHEQVLGAAAREARALGSPVDLRIAATEETDLGAILDIAEDVGLPVIRVGVLDSARHVTTAPLWARLRDAAAGRQLELVAGARSHFTEFNREIHEIPRDADAFTFPSTPQMHMRETWHVIAGLGALGDVLDSAATLRPGRPLHLGPVTLRPRLNAVATRPELVDRSTAEGYGAHLVAGATDPRQHSSWAAAWSAAVILRAATAGVRSVTLGELAGPRGLLLPDGRLGPIGEIAVLLGSLAGDEAQIACDVAGPGTALARWGERLLAVNARLEDWTLHLPGGSPAEPDSLRVPAGSYRLLTLPSAAVRPGP